jgi:hypothetical protein
MGSVPECMLRLKKPQQSNTFVGMSYVLVKVYCPPCETPKVKQGDVRAKVLSAVNGNPFTQPTCILIYGKCFGRFYDDFVRR